MEYITPSRFFNKVLDTIAEKDARYQSSFSETFQRYGLTTSCIRLTDKLNRLHYLDSVVGLDDKYDAIFDTLLDMAGYIALTIQELDYVDDEEN